MKKWLGTIYDGIYVIGMFALPLMALVECHREQYQKAMVDMLFVIFLSLPVKRKS